MNKYNDFSNLVYKNSYENSIASLLDFVECNYKKEDIKEILLSENDDIKPFAIINIQSINTKEEFNFLISNLIDHDGRIREAVSFVLSELSFNQNLFDKNSIDVILKSLLDINPNVIRNVIEFISKNEKVKEEITLPLVLETKNCIEFLRKYNKNSKYRENKEKSFKNQAKNRYTFNLYWLLETISILNVDKIDDIENILFQTSNFLDYTIREKTAKILSKMQNKNKELLHKLKNDVNIYVKNQLL